MPEHILTPQQIEDLAKPIVAMIPAIIEFYQNPENERRYQEWYKQKYGKAAADAVNTAESPEDLDDKMLALFSAK